MKNILIIVSFFLSAVFFGQNMQVQNMVNYLRNKDFEKAKAAADAAAVHESTKTSPKMWMLRGNVYKAMALDTSQKVKSLDPDAAEKALEAYITCLSYDKDNIYKDEVKSNIAQTCAMVNRKAHAYINNKQYENALRDYELIEKALPYDFDGNLKDQKLTPDNLTAMKYDVYRLSGNKEKSKELANKLVDAKFKDANIYIDMVKMSIADKDTAGALGYIEKGKAIYQDNMTLIATEIDIYIARKKTDVLLDKLKAAIEIAPKNESLHLVLANIYRKMNKFDEAEKEYLKALEIKPDYEAGNYNLAVLYYSSAKEWNDKLNALPMKDPKAKEYEAKSNDYFKKAVGYFEKSYEVTKDKQTRQILRQITLRLGDTERAEKYK